MVAKPRILSEKGACDSFVIVACFSCPYLQSYDLIWRDSANPDVICVMLWCCAGPELQVRRGRELVIDEFLATRTLVYERAEQLRDGAWTGVVRSAGQGGRASAKS